MLAFFTVTEWLAQATYKGELSLVQILECSYSEVHPRPWQWLFPGMVLWWVRAPDLESDHISIQELRELKEPGFSFSIHSGELKGSHRTTEGLCKLSHVLNDLRPSHYILPSKGTTTHGWGFRGHKPYSNDSYLFGCISKLRLLENEENLKVLYINFVGQYLQMFGSTLKRRVGIWEQRHYIILVRRVNHMA